MAMCDAILLPWSITFSTGVGRQAREDKMATAKKAIASANAPNMKLGYALSEGIGVNGMTLTQGLKLAIVNQF